MYKWQFCSKIFNTAAKSPIRLQVGLLKSKEIDPYLIIRCLATWSSMGFTLFWIKSIVVELHELANEIWLFQEKKRRRSKHCITAQPRVEPLREIVENSYNGRRTWRDRDAILKVQLLMRKESTTWNYGTRIFEGMEVATTKVLLRDGYGSRRPINTKFSCANPTPPKKKNQQILSLSDL